MGEMTITESLAALSAVVEAVASDLEEACAALGLSGMEVDVSAPAGGRHEVSLQGYDDRMDLRVSFTRVIGGGNGD